LRTRNFFLSDKGTIAMNKERYREPARAATLLAASVFAALCTFAQNGTLDVSFSGDGQVGFIPEIPNVITCEILETGGSSFSILSGVNGTTSSYILKLNEDGSFATGFGVNGILEFPGIGLVDAALSQDETRIFLLTSGTESYQLSAIDLNGAMVQPYTPLVAPGGGSFAKMLVDEQGRICIGKGAYVDEVVHGQVLRLNADFTADNTFGTNGMAYTPAVPFSYPLMEIDNVGRVVLGSYGSGAAGIWRFNTNGTLDATFNYTLDLSTYSLDNWILDIAIAHDNSIYVQPNTWSWPSYLFKLLPNGTLDMSFGTGGYMIMTDPEPLWYTAPDELLIEPNGGLIILAQAYGPEGYMSGKYLMRLDENGAIDGAFDPGIQPIDDNGFSLRINFHCATLQDDGKVLSMDQVVKWRNGELFGYAPLITRFNNAKGSVTASVNDAGPRVEQAWAVPNPTSGSVALHAVGLGAWQNATVIVTNSAGATVKQEQLVSDRVDLSALDPGVYFCVVKHRGGSHRFRIVKE
jgi:uncharacterized delta-60 repeat protein